jgi:hypothetical protein
VERGQANQRRGSSIGLTTIDLWRWTGRGVTGERRRRSSGDAPVGTRTAVREGAGLNHVLHGKLPCDLGKALSSCLGSGKQRRCELDGVGLAAAAGNRVSATVWLVLINKCLGEVLWCTRKSLGVWVREDGDWKRVRTERRQWRTAAARENCACARRATGAGLYGR